LFAVNTGCREQEVCQLRWDWEVSLQENDTSLFVLPALATKTSTERVVVLNTIARRVIEARRGIHKEYVFTYRGNPIGKLNNSAWKRAWRLVGLPTDKGILKGVHNLRHTYGKRLRSAGIPLETRKALLGQANGDKTTHYSAAELQELIDAVEAIVSRGGTDTPNLMLIGRNTEKTVGKVSEIKKGLAEKIG
jgi:integrase